MRTLNRLRSAALAVLVAGGSLAAVLAVAGPASADTVSDCTQWGTTSLQGGEYTYQQNEWNSTSAQCASIDTGTGAWSLSQANFGLATNGAPATYPSTYKGCHWGACTANSGLPIQVSKLGSATSSWSTTQVGSGAYDVAYDIWFNSTPTTDGQPDGTELMIWLNSRGGVQPFGGKTGTASVAGHSWDVWTGQQSSWKIISYVLQGGATSVSNLDIKALSDDAVSRGSLNPSHYLIDAEAGFEVWQGGQGLATNSFSFSASESGGDPGDPGNPGDPGTGRCSATLHVDSDWGSGFTATVTVTNTGSVPIDHWRVGWTWPGAQHIVNAWNTTVTQSGTSVVAQNVSYNGALPPGASTTFGFQATGSGGVPTLTCTT